MYVDLVVLPGMEFHMKRSLLSQACVANVHLASKEFTFVCLQRGYKLHSCDINPVYQVLLLHNNSIHGMVLVMENISRCLKEVLRT